MALDDVISQNRTSNKRSNTSNNSNPRRGNSRGGAGGISKSRSSGVRSSVCY